MNCFSLFFRAVEATPIDILVFVFPDEDMPMPPAGGNASASAPAGEATDSDAAAKTGSRVYYHVDVFDPAETVAWLIANGYGDYVITTDPKPHKGMLMKLLKAGYEIPGSRLAVSNHCVQNDAE